MNTYVWHSKKTKESGALIGRQVASPGESFVGTNPPKNFEGVGVCFGARPADVFKWENRSFKALFNDPRKITELTSNKPRLFSRIKRAGAPTLKTAPVGRESDYADLSNILGGPFYCCTKSLTGAVLVSNQDELQSAFQEDKTTAIAEDFKNKETCRVYVSDGSPIVTLSKSFDQDKIIRKMATGGDGQMCSNTYAKLKGWKDSGRISIGKDEYILEEGTEDVGAFNTSAVISAIGDRAQMYCIEYTKVSGRFTVSNVIFSPSLEVLSDVALNSICSSINTWVEHHCTTFKEDLLKMITDASEAQAEEMLGAINQYANG